jgi:hypothetical protein
MRRQNSTGELSSISGCGDVHELEANVEEISKKDVPQQDKIKELEFLVEKLIRFSAYS